MTAEIAVMNKWAIALAADSAVTIETIESTKIYETNKLFMLSKFQPVGIMVYGNAELMGVPWEAIIKRYRIDELKDQCFDRLQDYGDHFIAYLDRTNPLYFPDQQQVDNVYGSAYSFLIGINREINETVEQFTHKAVKISAGRVARIVNTAIKNHFDDVEQLPLLTTLPVGFDKEILRKYDQIFNQAINDVFQKLPVSASAHKQLRRICVNLFVRDMSHYLVNLSGIVIAGFGENELFPSLISYEIECVVNDRLKYKNSAGAQVTHKHTAALVPFAQKEMVISFMVGVAPAYQEALGEYLNVIFEEYPEKLVKGIKHLTVRQKAALLEQMKKDGVSLMASFWNNIGAWSKEQNIDKILSAVSVLPKEELASMAESLVNLTSFKRRVTLDAETVGGPIDVAVISKGDGFIWINRKHYFDANTNPHFLRNYYR